VEVDSTIASAVTRERQGNLEAAIDMLTALVAGQGREDAKAHYFLARVLHHAAAKATGAEAADLRRRSAEALRQVPPLAKGSPHGEDARWADTAAEQLRRRSRATPLLNQYGGGSYPHGYCAPTSLRMLLRLEGLADPGPDAVALRGARPYSPGAGSDGFALARRARELGLAGTTFTKGGSLAQVVASIDAGRPAAVAGVGPYAATLATGGRKARSYGAGHWLVAVDYRRAADGTVESVTLNDPDGGQRVTMTRADFLRFFAPDGKIWTLTYGG
jgi:hypothetical protein